MTIYLDDEMEDGNSTYFQDAYDENTTCNSVEHVTYNTTTKVSGAGSLQFNFNAASGEPCNFLGNSKNFTSTDDLYCRYYLRLGTDWVTGSPTTKMFLFAADPYSFWIVFNVGATKPVVWGQLWESNPGDNTKFECSGSIPKDDSWNLLEVHVLMNTSGVSDGVVEVWINGTKQTLTDISINNPGTRNPEALEIRSGTPSWNAFELFKQHGVGTMGFDRFAVANERIGAIGGGGSSTRRASTVVLGGQRVQLLLDT